MKTGKWEINSIIMHRLLTISWFQEISWKIWTLKISTPRKWSSGLKIWTPWWGGHTRVTIYDDRLRHVVASERKKLVRTVFLVTLLETSLRVIYHLSQSNVRRPCNGRKWSYKYLQVTASDCKNVCHRPHARLRSPAAYLRHMRNYIRSTYGIPAITCVHRIDIIRESAYCPKYFVLFCFCFTVCIRGSQRRRLYICHIIAIQYAKLYWWVKKFNDVFGEFVCFCISDGSQIWNLKLSYIIC